MGVDLIFKGQTVFLHCKLAFMHNLVGGAQRCSHHSVLLSNRVLKKQGIESFNSRESSQGTAALRQFSGGKGSP